MLPLIDSNQEDEEYLESEYLKKEGFLGEGENLM
jgi:hypothetical protein